LEYHNEIDLIVLGFPLKLNNKSSPWSDTVVEFGKLLKVTFKNIHVKLQDERFSTKQATGYLKQLGFKHSKVKNIKDKLSAQIILQNYLELNV
jgi:putative Holliday junction resolvase